MAMTVGDSKPQAMQILDRIADHLASLRSSIAAAVPELEAVLGKQRRQAAAGQVLLHNVREVLQTLEDEAPRGTATLRLRAAVQTLSPEIES